jgi:TonB family protein
MKNNFLERMQKSSPFIISCFGHFILIAVIVYTGMSHGSMYIDASSQSLKSAAEKSNLFIDTTLENINTAFKKEDTYMPVEMVYASLEVGTYLPDKDKNAEDKAVLDNEIQEVVYSNRIMTEDPSRSMSFLSSQNTTAANRVTVKSRNDNSSKTIKINSLKEEKVSKFNKEHTESTLPHTTDLPSLTAQENENQSGVPDDAGFSQEITAKNTLDSQNNKEVSVLGGEESGSFSTWLAKYKFYPLEAKRRGEQGTVLMRVTINQEGYLSNFSIIQSSGSRSLDEAAKEILRRASLLPQRFAQNIQIADVPLVFSLRS